MSRLPLRKPAGPKRHSWPGRNRRLLWPLIRETGSRRPSAETSASISCLPRAARSISRSVPLRQLRAWVGCASSFDECAAHRGVDREVAPDRRRRLCDPRTARKLHRDPAGRMAANTCSGRSPSRTLRSLNQSRLTKILTLPALLHTLANEYPDFGGNYEPIHLAKLLASMVRDDQLSPWRSGELKALITTPTIWPAATTCSRSTRARESSHRDARRRRAGHRRSEASRRRGGGAGGGARGVARRVSRRG